MLWLYLLGIVTFLIIVLRRVLRRMKPLSAELHSQRVAIDNVYTGVAWVGADGKLASVNSALSRSIDIESSDLVGKEWTELFAPGERDKVQAAYRQMLLAGKASLSARGFHADGELPWFDVILVSVHDDRMRLVGHHCLIEDRTTEHQLQQRVEQLTKTSAPVH